jgi:predicted MFS family arabinose efflux permease
VRPALRRQLFFAALYFAEGAPIGWLWWALPSQLRREGVEVDSITALTAALAVPWALKFLWAPLVDVLRGRFFGLRAWIATAQLGMAATLVPLLALDVASLPTVSALLLAHAFFAATQDVAVDALAIAVVPNDERGRLNGAMQVGMIGGRVLFSSGALVLGARLGDQSVVVMLLAVLVSTIALVVFAAPAAPTPAARRPGRRWRYLRTLLRTPRILALAAFALLGGAGFEAAGSLSGSWLVDRGFGDDAIAAFRLLSALLMALGAVAGGAMADRLDRRRVAGRWLLALAALVAALAALDANSARAAALSTLAVVYFAVGGFTAASYGLFMAHAAGPLAATVFSGFMGMTNLCEAWAGRMAGALQTAQGYPTALLVLAGLSLLGLPLLQAMRGGSRRRRGSGRG